MKILLLTPGTGNFHCGSCLHDEALLRGLRSLGHDAAINALYLPLVLDSTQGIDGDDVHMGGINLYLQARSHGYRLVPGFARRLLDRPGLLRRAATRADMTSPTELGRITEQMLLGQHGRTRLEISRMLGHLREEGHPDVVLLNNALLLGLAEPIKEALGCPVACTLQGEDTFVDGLPEPYRARVWELLAEKSRDVSVFLPVSQYHANLMARRLDLPAANTRVVYNGIEADRYPPQCTSPDPPVIGFLARLCEYKGLGILVDAYVIMHKRGTLGETRLLLAGAATPGDMAYVEAQRRKLEAAGLRQSVRIETNVSFEQKVQLLHGMALLSVPAAYGESFGLYVLEANAVGVPVVVPNHAGLAEVIGLTGGGILCRPNDPESLADTLAGLLADDARRRSLGEAGRRAVLESFTAAHMSARAAAALESVCQAPTP
ncbi:glycosyltransferase family 4 protein [Phycisphaeraceae bacterium D3-23]